MAYILWERKPIISVRGIELELPSSPKLALLGRGSSTEKSALRKPGLDSLEERLDSLPRLPRAPSSCSNSVLIWARRKGLSASSGRAPRTCAIPEAAQREAAMISGSDAKSG